MKLYIIYDSYQYSVNRWFAEHLLECAADCSLDAELIISEDLTTGISGGEAYALYNGQHLTKNSAVIMRTISPFLSEFLETAGFSVFNSAEISRICNDKRLSYLKAADAGAKIIDTQFADNITEIKLPFPYVIKTPDGHGGKEIFPVSNLSEKLSAEDFFAGRKKMLAQEFSPVIGKDIRFYCLGGSFLKAVERSSAGGFKSNFSLGGTASAYEPNEEELSLLYSLLNVFSKTPDFIGVDFLPGLPGENDKPTLYFNEFEDVVGTRTLYSVYNIDAARLFIDYITKMI